MQCFEASIIFRVASCFRCPRHFCLGQTLGTHFRRIPFSTIESMPGARYGVDVKSTSCESELFVLSCFMILGFLGYTARTVDLRKDGC